MQRYEKDIIRYNILIYFAQIFHFDLRSKLLMLGKVDANLMVFLRLKPQAQGGEQTVSNGTPGLKL